MITLPNVQPTEKPSYDPNGLLDVFKVFPTIQGEGPFAGRPCVFVRLAGCNLQCKLCDTDYTSQRWVLNPEQLIEAVFQVMPRKSPLIVITGGEPMRQNIWKFVRLAIADEDFEVQIETNGTLDPRMELRAVADLHIVCSPKSPKIHESIMANACALKYVVEAGKVSPDDGLPTSVLGEPCMVARPGTQFLGKIYISPADEQDPVKNKANIDEAVRSCMNHGYYLSLQTHKYIGVE